ENGEDTFSIFNSQFLIWYGAGQEENIRAAAEAYPSADVCCMPADRCQTWAVSPGARRRGTRGGRPERQASWARRILVPRPGLLGAGAEAARARASATN